MSDPKAFLDTETLGLTDQHATVEVAVAYETGDPLHWRLPVHTDDLVVADPGALDVNGFERRIFNHQPDMFADVHIRRALSGYRVVGSNPDFDTSRLLRRWGITVDSRAVPWLRRPINLATYAMGVLNLDDPIGMAGLVDLLNDEYGADIEPEGVHTAVSGVLTTRACYQFLRRAADRRDVVTLVT